MITINRDLVIPESELLFTFSRSRGPGGQNVNKVNSKVMLWFDVANSPTLTDLQKSTIRTKLGRRVNKDGVLRVMSQARRSQAENRMLATERFVELLRKAFGRHRRRRPTSVPRVVVEQRLLAKKRRSRLKEQRGKLAGVVEAF